MAASHFPYATPQKWTNLISTSSVVSIRVLVEGRFIEITIFQMTLQIHRERFTTKHSYSKIIQPNLFVHTRKIQVIWTFFAQSIFKGPLSWWIINLKLLDHCYLNGSAYFEGFTYNTSLTSRWCWAWSRSGWWSWCSGNRTLSRERGTWPGWRLPERQSCQRPTSWWAWKRSGMRRLTKFWQLRGF